ncbi:MbtH family NRPS accessory protein [Umezawaea sp. Da 62-37]|uniref:MbtH family protein n=1 Tax=Umezawaea sp. Da 62-37 TaxID=3075927 RepID=UPI0028F72B24|nr:MbtH family NRPS accessory protein [Umezawaea sp. Da 62-37]WNV85522.1 MbtH family NRPS accessory protein [Umezawaea sp. Da 62-37]
MDTVVVVNDEEQYSVWSAATEPPAGWRTVGGPGTREECLARIDGLWTDMRPLSPRRRTG